ncbi:cullin-associated NEDD8-dissociated protein 1-like isoform X1 [Oryza glaberrima]|uniref:cullin-associated NEDD8-dissociated protein 1-like isoform X1 n=1 Tax=Oryza glaberrima TaxID=4538 RepID=UPI00224BE61D|nr:cullin-associated NEDD8-dissociated protein 1-like isoform X1 [Oryza glaberrima]
MANMNITTILEKMTGKDKDYRYMATSDLLSELNKEGFKADQDIEPKLTTTVLQQLEDASGGVSGLAVKCLAPLVKKVGEDSVVEMTNILRDKLLNGKDQHRDTASIALKTIIAEVTTTSLAEKILVSLAPQLIKGATAGKSAEVKCECLDILGDVLHRFGNLITKDHDCMLTALLSQLSSNQASVRKKSISCIASLAACLSDDLLAKATFEVVQLLKNRSAKSEIARTNIQMIGALSRSVGYRFGPHLAEVVPLLINYCTSASENDEELREYSLQALESFMLRCPRDISPYCESILNLALEYISYDPNFTDSMEENTDDEAQDEEDDDESANEYTDDEDASWKVRRASAKCLYAIIVSRPEMLSKMYLEACPKLIEWFREREENVKTDIFNTFIELLHQTGNMTKGQGDIDESSPRWLLKQEVPKVVKSINRQLREKSIKTKVGAFSVLKELVVVLPDCLADHIGSLVPGIEKALNDKSSTSNLKIEALVFTRLVMASHSPAVFHPYIQALSGPILSAIGDRYDKVTAEALRVCEELVRVLRPNSEPHSPDYRPYIGPIYKAILARLANQDQDQDQEVKECAISCMSLALSTFGDGLQRELPACLPVLVDRMGNEITRLTAVKEIEHNGQPLGLVKSPSSVVEQNEQIVESNDDLTLIRYLIKWIPAQPWADGEIYLYSPDTHSWSSQGMKMKFFIMDEKYNMEAKGIYKKIDELVNLANHSMFLAPVFALHDKKIGRIILCYPKFDQLLKDWLPAQAFKGRFIPPIWMHLIKDVISYMSNTDNLAASLGSIDSYVLETKPERIKVILFPFESREAYWRKDFATFLIEHLRNKWKSTMLDHFINILQKDFKIGDIQHHPLLQDFDQLSNMIRMTWRESKHLTVERRVLLSSTLNAIRNNIPWTSVTTTDAVVNEYISKATNDSLGLFTEIKKIAAHYIENRRKLNKEKGICNRRQVHPIEIIEEIWPGAIEEIYELSLKSEWLTT